MVDKENVTPHGIPSDDGSFSDIQNEFEDCYSSIMDSSFAALGREITLHLIPKKTEDTATQAQAPATRYNPHSRGRGRQVPTSISSTRVPAVEITHRDVTYIAHIKHGPKEANDNSGVRLEENEVQLTTVIQSKLHITSALSVTVDNMRYNLDSIRPIGLQNPRYIISKWKMINEAQDT